MNHFSSQRAETEENKSETTLTHIRVAGFVANLEGYAFGIEDNGRQRSALLWYLSMVKDQTTVNAIWASLVKEPPLPVVLFRQDREGRITREILTSFAPYTRSGGSTTHQVALRQSGAVHKILLPQCARAPKKRKRQRDNKAQPPPGSGEFVLLLPKANSRRVMPDPSRLYYERLVEATDEPLHPAWLDWLWEKGVTNREILPLEHHGLTAAYHCRLPAAQEFSEQIEAAIRQGLLTVEAAIPTS